MALADTSSEARRRQIECYARTPGSDKVMLATEMAEQAKAIAIEGIRFRHPDLSDAAVHSAWLRQLHGDLATCLCGTSQTQTE